MRALENFGGRFLTPEQRLQLRGYKKQLRTVKHAARALDWEPGDALSSRFAQAGAIRTRALMSPQAAMLRARGIIPGGYGQWMEAAGAAASMLPGLIPGGDEEEENGYKEVYEAEMARQAREAQRARRVAQRAQQKAKLQAARAKKKTGKRKGMGQYLPLILGGAVLYMVMGKKK